jgi:hypothetical protein
VTRRLALGIGGALGLAWACAPHSDVGPVHRVYLDEDAPLSGGNAGQTGQAGQAGEPGSPSQPPVAPTVTAMMPLSGPYGSEIRIQGEGLGSAAREGVSILLGAEGDAELTPMKKPEILSWSETEIRFRFPFPQAGRVLVKTPEGEVEAGEFEPTWEPGPAFDSIANVVSTASLAPAQGTIAAVLDTGPPSLVAFDGRAWSALDIAGKNLRADSIRLYLDGGDLAAFALSTATAPEIIALDPADAFSQTASGVKVTSDYRVAGGPGGATVWWRSGNNWSRARPSGGSWALDKGPIGDPNPSGARHAAGSTADGTLFVAWGEDTGSTFDDKGAAFHRRLPADAAAFETKVRTGGDVDDAVSGITLYDRGNGLLIRYCGTDKDPLGATGNETLCYTALPPSDVKMTTSERANLRYAFGPDAQPVAYCSASKGLRLAPTVGSGASDQGELEALAADIVAWPCPNVLALEVDPDGEPLLIIEQDGTLYSPRPRVR